MKGKKPGEIPKKKKGMTMNKSKDIVNEKKFDPQKKNFVAKTQLRKCSGKLTQLTGPSKTLFNTLFSYHHLY